MIKRIIPLLLFIGLVFWTCEKDEEPLPEDCSGVAGGNSVCGCTDSTATNYDSTATFDDGGCAYYIDNGEFFLSFDGVDDYADVGDMLSQGAYTKAAWVQSNTTESGSYNIISGNTGHALWAPNSVLSAGHNGTYTSVQDTEALAVGVWYFVAVTYDSASGTMTLYKNGIQVDDAIDIAAPDESTTTYIGRFAGGSYWAGSVDEAAIWNEALSSAEIGALYNSGGGLDASTDSGDYTSSVSLQGYWMMNEGIETTLTDASGNGNTGTISGSEWMTEGGCTDAEACNYNPQAVGDNGSCVYTDGICETCEDGAIVDNDADGDELCNDIDDDDDNDGVADDVDSDSLNNFVCSDTDSDGCDDCSSGIYDPSNDGTDDDGDGICNAFLIPGHTVYIVGGSYNSEGIQTTCYWMDGVRVELQGGDWATDIVVSNGNVYVSGTSGANACYWINETRYDLPGDGGEGEAIAVDGDDVYVAGWFDNGSCYWKNGERINLTTNAESQAFAVGLRSNGDVYVGGYYMNNHHYYIPCFWKNGNNRTNLSIPSGGDGEVYDMAFMDGNTRYYAGYTLHPDNFAGYVPKACYWRNAGSRTDLPLGGSSWDIYGATGWGIAIDGEDIYVAGYTDWYEFTGEEETTGGSFPQYWKNSTIHDLEGGPLTNFGTGVAYDIRVADGNVVVVGEATRDSSYYDSYLSACYWLNGERHYLVKQSQVPEGLEDWYWSEAMGVFIE